MTVVTSAGADHSVPKASGAGVKTLAVLAAAVEHSRFTDIVRETGLAKATVHRILATLVEEQFLGGSAELGYRSGPRMLSLAGAALGSVDISATAHPIVASLVEQTGCTVHVGVATGTEMVYVIRQDGAQPYRMRSRVGLSIPMHCSGMGKAVLAFRPPAEVDALIDVVGLERRTAKTIVDREALHVELARVRARGFATDLGENEDGTVCVSAPIRDHTGAVTRAMSVSSIELQHPGTTIERFAPAATAAAAEISRLLGAPDRSAA